MSNVEVRNSIDFYESKRQSVAIPSFEILRFAVQSFIKALYHKCDRFYRLGR